MKDRDRTEVPVEPAALTQALEQSQEVRAKVEEAANDLGSANDMVKKKIADGATTLSAHQALQNSERVEIKVQECADELHEVNETLAKGIDDLNQTEMALATARQALSDTESALVVAREEEERARLRALHDSTTGLPNRDLFDDRMAHAISLAERHDWMLAVMFIDLDNFKGINDTHGHVVGDRVLKEVAKRLLRHCRHEDTVCRNGGDEFLYLLIDPQGLENIERIAAFVLNAIAEPINIGDLQLVIGSSIGIAVYPSNGTAGEQLIRNADTAMYRAKKTRSGWLFLGHHETEGISG